MINTEFKTWWANYWLSPFSWSRWTDIDVFYYDTHPFLLQGRVNKKSNAKQFRVTSIKKHYRTRFNNGLEYRKPY